MVLCCGSCYYEGETLSAPQLTVGRSTSLSLSLSAFCSSFSFPVSQTFLLSPPFITFPCCPLLSHPRLSHSSQSQFTLSFLSISLPVLCHPPPSTYPLPLTFPPSRLSPSLPPPSPHSSGAPQPPPSPSLPSGPSSPQNSSGPARAFTRGAPRWPSLPSVGWGLLCHP